MNMDVAARNRLAELMYEVKDKVPDGTFLEFMNILGKKENKPSDDESDDDSDEVLVRMHCAGVSYLLLGGVCGIPCVIKCSEFARKRRHAATKRTTMATSPFGSSLSTQGEKTTATMPPNAEKLPLKIPKSCGGAK